MGLDLCPSGLGLASPREAISQTVLLGPCSVVRASASSRPVNTWLMASGPCSVVRASAGSPLDYRASEHMTNGLRIYSRREPAHGFALGTKLNTILVLTIYSLAHLFSQWMSWGKCEWSSSECNSGGMTAEDTCFLVSYSASLAKLPTLETVQLSPVWYQLAQEMNSGKCILLLYHILIQYS